MEFEKTKFNLSTLIMACSALITLIGYLNNKFSDIENRFDYFEKKYLIAVNAQALINQSNTFRIEALEAKKTPNKKIAYPSLQGVLPGQIKLEEDGNG